MTFQARIVPWKRDEEAESTLESVGTEGAVQKQLGLDTEKEVYPTPCPLFTSWQVFQTYTVIIVSLALVFTLCVKLNRGETAANVRLDTPWTQRFINTLLLNALPTYPILWMYIAGMYFWGGASPSDCWWRGAPGQHMSLLLVQSLWMWYIGLAISSVICTVLGVYDKQDGDILGV